MPDVNFRESAIRHWNDSRTLATAGEVANVGQLLGFSAECGLKAIYRCFFLPSAPNGDIAWTPTLKKKYRKHVDMLYSTVATLANSPGAAKYVQMIPSIANFSSWNTEQRYWSEAEHAATCAALIPRWEIAAKEVLAMVTAAQIDGMAI